MRVGDATGGVTVAGRAYQILAYLRGVIDPLALWLARPPDERDAIRAVIQAFADRVPPRDFPNDPFRMPVVEVFAATRDGGDLVVHAIFDYEVMVSQQVGADIIEHHVCVVTSIGSLVSFKWSSVDQFDEREPDHDYSPAIEALRERTLAALFGGELTEAEDALLAAIEAAPDADGPRLVYADWLQERGDPRGHFIALQRAGKSTPELAGQHLKSIPWAVAGHTIFDRGFVAVLGLSSPSAFLDCLDKYARMRPLPSQFVAVGSAQLVACISRDRRRFASADTFRRTSRKRTSGVWKIVVGRCADRSRLFTIDLEWTHYRNTGTQLIERVAFVRDGAALQLEFQTGEAPMIVELP